LAILLKHTIGNTFKYSFGIGNTLINSADIDSALFCIVDSSDTHIDYAQVYQYIHVDSRVYTRCIKTDT
jgi:hypothetical protein